MNHAIAKDPGSAWAFFNRAMTYTDMQRIDEALADFVHAIELDSSNRDSYRNVGVLLVERGLLKEALPYFEKAGELGDLQCQEMSKEIRKRVG